MEERKDVRQMKSEGLRLNLLIGMTLFLIGMRAANGADALSKGKPDPVEKYRIEVATERENARYEIGETVRFRINVWRGAVPADTGSVQYAFSDSSRRWEYAKGQLSLNGKPQSVEWKPDHPGFLFCWVEFSPPAGKALVSPAAAAVSPDQIKPSLPVPEDFDQFWAEQKKKLAAIPMEPTVTPVDAPDARRQKLDCFDVQVKCLGGAPVSAYMAKPKGAGPRSLPIVLHVHSAGIKPSNLDTACGYAARGMLAMDMNAHGLPNMKNEEYARQAKLLETARYSQQGKDNRETSYFRGMFLRIVRAIDFLTAQPEWDGKVVAVIGASQGGGQALVAGGLDSRVTFVGASCPALCDHSGMLAGRGPGWPGLVPYLAGAADRKPDPVILDAARYFDAVNFSSRSRGETIVDIGFTDTTCAADGQYAAYNQLKGNKQAILQPFGGHWIDDWGKQPPGVDASERFMNAVKKQAGR